MRIELYKWPPSHALDAPNPRGVTVNRILTYLGVDFEAKIVSPTQTDLDPVKIGLMMAGFPMVAINSKKTNGIFQILNLIENSFQSDKAKTLWVNKNEAAVLNAWAFDHFYFLAIFARMKIENNFQSYLRTVMSIYSETEATKMFSVIRQMFLESLKWSSLGSLSEYQFQEVLRSSLASLDEKLKSNRFLMTSENPSVADFAMFGPLQSLLAPEVSESKWILEIYPKIASWAKTMDQLSTGKWTRPLSGV